MRQGALILSRGFIFNHVKIHWGHGCFAQDVIHRTMPSERLKPPAEPWRVFLITVNTSRCPSIVEAPKTLCFRAHDFLWGLKNPSSRLMIRIQFQV
jgi:hypothetical protein